MFHPTINLPDGIDPSTIGPAIERACNAENLVCVEKRVWGINADVITWDFRRSEDGGGFSSFEGCIRDRNDPVAILHIVVDARTRTIEMNIVPGETRGWGPLSLYERLVMVRSRLQKEFRSFAKSLR